VINLKNITWITILTGSIPEAFFIFLIGLTLIGYRVSLKKLILISFIEGIFVYILFNYIKVPFGIHSISTFLFLVIITNLLIKVNIKNSFIAIVIGWMASFLTQYINLIFIYLLGMTYDDLMKNEALRMIAFYPSIISLGIIALIIYKKNIVIYNACISSNNEKISKNSNFVVKISFLLIFIVLILFNIYLYIFRNESWNLEKRFTVFIIVFSIIALSLMIIISLKLFEKNIKKEYEDILLEKNLEDMKRNIKVLRKQRHDYLRHIQIVSSLLHTNNYDEAKNYINDLAEHINSEGISVETGNTFLNAVISLKQEQAIHRKIKFYINIKIKIKGFKIPNFELCNILSNIIDNAFDALDEVRKDKKYVELCICGDDLFYIFKIRNNGNKIEDTQKIFDEGFSTKQGINRGYGLYIVKQILDKYKSSIFVESSESITEFTIVIPKY
jgi:signal transduction histidine kinase